MRPYVFFDVLNLFLPKVLCLCKEGAFGLKIKLIFTSSHNTRWARFHSPLACALCFTFFHLRDSEEMDQDWEATLSARLRDSEEMDQDWEATLSARLSWGLGMHQSLPTIPSQMRLLPEAPPASSPDATAWLEKRNRERGHGNRGCWSVLPNNWRCGVWCGIGNL